MIKITKSYKDYNGTERNEDFYFHLTQADILKLELSKQGGLSAYAKRIVAAQNVPELSELFSELLDLSYGVPSDDGRTFQKRPEQLLAFKESIPYSMIYMDLVTDTKKASEFFNGIADPEVIARAHEEAAKVDEPNLLTLVNP